MEIPVKRISEHITLAEAVRSDNAKRLGIDNSATLLEIERMRLVAESCFEPLRNRHGKPIFISSFFRSKKLNDATPESSNFSQHMCGAYSGIEESAMDIDCDVFDNGLTNAQAFMWLRDNVEFDQLIWEFGDSFNPDWVHVSYRKGGNRKQVLQSFRHVNNGRSKVIIVPYKNPL